MALLPCHDDTGYFYAARLTAHFYFARRDDERHVGGTAIQITPRRLWAAHTDA